MKTKRVETIETRQPCEDKGGRDESELCASWRAADAAEKSALWAWFQMVFSLFGIAGLGITLWLNKRAIDIAREAIASDNRAWLSLEISMGDWPFAVLNGV